MIIAMFQKTATSELWWIGSALALIVIAWVGVGLFRLLKRKPEQNQEEAQQVESEEQER